MTTTTTTPIRRLEPASRAPAGVDVLRVLALVAGFLVTSAAQSGEAAAAEELASPWVEGHNVRTRLIAGVGEVQLGRLTFTDQVVAGLEMELGEGWKTYWRMPGDAGGVPPEFDFAGSSNVVRTGVLYPAAKRLTDRAGSTVGYKKHVVFPILVTPERAGEAVTLKVQLAFGVCREICVPSEASYEVTVPAEAKPPKPAALVQALARVPFPVSGGGPQIGGVNPDAPLLQKTEAALEGPAPKLTLHVSFPATAGADVFVEGPPGEFVPLPRQAGKLDEKTLVYEIDLAKGADVKALKGQPLRVTMVSDAGASETTFVLQDGAGPVPPKP